MCVDCAIMRYTKFLLFVYIYYIEKRVRTCNVSYVYDLL